MKTWFLGILAKKITEFRVGKVFWGGQREVWQWWGWDPALNVQRRVLEFSKGMARGLLRVPPSGTFKKR